MHSVFFSVLVRDDGDTVIVHAWHLLCSRGTQPSVSLAHRASHMRRAACVDASSTL